MAACQISDSLHRLLVCWQNMYNYYSGADLKGGFNMSGPFPPLKFEKCSFYLGFLKMYLRF